MKKQLFTLAVLTLGYVASSHGGGTLVLVYMTNIKETMAAGTTQKVNAIDARIESEKPKVHGQSVLRLEQTEEGKWLIITENPGTATIILEKREPGFSPERKRNVCKHKITVTGSAKDGEGIEVDEIESDDDYDDHDSDTETDAQGHSRDDVFSDV